MTFWWLTAGCIDTIRFPPVQEFTEGHTGGPAEATEVGLVQIAEVLSDGCVDGDWLISARTDGWSLSADVSFVSGGAGETHTLFIVATDPDGAWDELSTTSLTAGADPAVPNESSAFACGVDGLSFAIRVRDRADVLSDCVVWGADPEAAAVYLRDRDPELTALGSCRAWPFAEAR